ncbi:MAG: hypothetical protein AB1925_16525 [Actinomycetota bacterium]
MDDADDRRRLGSARLSAVFPLTPAAEYDGLVRLQVFSVGHLGAVVADPRVPFPHVASPTRSIARSSVVAAGYERRQLRSMAVAASKAVVEAL